MLALRVGARGFPPSWSSRERRYRVVSFLDGDVPKLIESRGSTYPLRSFSPTFL
ncbi:hypothetical protein CORC01_14134 [Colletotrichum orchidophilum]|uniref:Uncharacterized protein n=1 Tax=Colletotrichum orchidophilum TaxID=1209926 RepID=A0A1G4AN27_9PEZI|nr:uncharacterized protein CORC01_14134 [Colletotrichum orchidophilum]OHE90567.1 hypothetical protein CORC01_14134 [Colletotrichum orchidophilum]